MSPTMTDISQGLKPVCQVASSLCVVIMWYMGGLPHDTTQSTRELVHGPLAAPHT